MTQEAIAAAKADIEATDDLLARAMKLAGLVTTLFAYNENVKLGWF